MAHARERNPLPLNEGVGHTFVDQKHEGFTVFRSNLNRCVKTELCNGNLDPCNCIGSMEGGGS